MKHLCKFLTFWCLLVLGAANAQTSCSTPANLATVAYQTSASLSWTAGAGETAWNIEYGVSGFTQGTGTTVAVSANPYTLTGLTPGSSYQFYVQANCGNGDLSTWAGPYEFACNQFTDINAGLTPMANSSAAWGDYDNDGDLDIIMTGRDLSTTYTKIYSNTNGSFSEIATTLPAVSYGSAAWGDYDNDGDLDILLSGSSASGNIAKIYRNDNGLFTDIDAGLTGVWNSSVAWGDYDNDGDLDILLTGQVVGSYCISKLYRNDAGVFTDIDAGLTGVSNGSAAWGDYDNDGDLDILLSGNPANGNIAKIYRNDNGLFSDINAGITAVYNSSVAWGDYDNDGDLDILLTGRSANGNIAKIYRNDNGLFTDINAGLTGVWIGSAAWGDYDNDGDLDVLITGLSNGGKISKIYNNSGGVFTEINAGLTGVGSGSAAWGDYDNDGDLDILLSGNNGSFYSKIYRNNSTVANTRPGTPTNLVASYAWAGTGYTANLSWARPVDGQTPQNALSYNICVGKGPNATDIVSPMANIENGYRRVAGPGRTTGTNLEIKNLTPGTYYWSVQAIDPAFAGSGFATQGSFNITPEVTPPPAPVALGATAVSHNSFTTGWNVTESAVCYTLEVATDIAFTHLVARASAIADTSYTITRASAETAYYYRVKAVNQGGESSYSSTITLTTAILPFTEQSTISLTAISAGSTVWGDYDNDGDLDILLSGISASGNIAKIYRNDNGLFTDIDAGLTGAFNSSAAWGDYDNDGDLDIIISGYCSGIGAITRIYRNDAGVFTNINAGLTAVQYSSVAWADYDNDGDLDILLTGLSANGDISKIYRNNGGVFTDINAGLTGVQYSSVA